MEFRSKIKDAIVSKIVNKIGHQFDYTRVLVQIYDKLGLSSKNVT
ncbi:MAG: hypothetical protein ACE5SW_13410 [Nitrososphaeraceae archaeon]